MNRFINICTAFILLSTCTLAGEREGRDLLNQEANTVTDEDSPTPLHAAIRRQDLRSIKTLLESGANPQAALPRTGTPLEFARQQEESIKNHLIVSLLSAYTPPVTQNIANLKADCHRILFILAKANTDMELENIKWILELFPELVNERNRYSRTPLHVATAAGKYGAAKTLIEAGANPQARTRKCQTPLDLARKNGWSKTFPERFEKFKKLLGDPETEEPTAPPPLERTQEITEPTERCISFDPSLHLAAINNELQAAKELLQADHNINTVDGMGCTPLQLAL